MSRLGSKDPTLSPSWALLASEALPVFSMLCLSELMGDMLTHHYSKSKVEKLLPSFILKIKAPFQPEAIIE